jgi:hypothetical protein
MFGAVARFLRGVAFDREGFESFQRGARVGGRRVVARGLRGAERVLLWVKDDAFQWYTPVSVEIAGAAFTLDGLADGAWCGRWYEPWSGVWREEVELLATGGELALEVPPFARDVALSLARCELR